MKHLFLLAGAAALAFASPALAQPGRGHGVGHGMGHGYGMMAGPGYGPRGHVGYGAGGCPPGLAKKAMPCMPPGQAKKLFGIGDRVPLGYSLLSLGGLPHAIRTHHSFSSHDRFVYRGDYVYAVSPRTRLVTGVVRVRHY